jgi:molybdopterin synthase sulfur carrier subunit
MSIKVHYFASLKETLGRSGDEINAADAMTVRAVWALANPNQALLSNLLAAVNMEYVELDHPVEDGDDVAFFPPVTGG